MTTLLNTFTDQTWAQLGNTGLSRETAPRDWMRLHDLAVEAHKATAEFCELSFDEMNTLVAAAANGLPIAITHRARLNGTDTVQVTTRTCVITQFMGLGNSTASLYVRAWGFTYPLGLSSIVSVSVPEATYEYEEVQS
jgi:hypothetical protein